MISAIQENIIQFLLLLGNNLKFAGYHKTRQMFSHMIKVRYRINLSTIKLCYFVYLSIRITAIFISVRKVCLKNLRFILPSFRYVMTHDFCIVTFTLPSLIYVMTHGFYHSGAVNLVPTPIRQ